jgi:D-inositol-3-phosphate glycosyltransferase
MTGALTGALGGGPLRIAMVSEHASPLAAIGGVDAGGQNVHVAALSRALARRGHDVLVYTRRDGSALPTRVATADGYTVVHVPAGPPTDVPKDELLPYMVAFGRYLAREWLAEPVDLVHAHFWMSGVAATLAAREVGGPVVQTFHALGAVKQRHQGARDTSPAGRQRIERALCRDADHVVATCSDEVAELRRLGARGSRVSIVPCGVDLDHFTPDGPAAVGEEGRLRLLTVGRLVERKGVDDVIRALAQLPEAELVVAGGPDAELLETDPEAARLRRVARRHGVEDRVVLLGRVGRDAMPALFRSADLVVAVPWYEPFGIVPLEAMACGLAVVASRVGGLQDTVLDGVTGLLVPAREPDRLARALRGLLHDPARRQSMGRAGLDRVRARYGWDRVAEDTEAVYQRVLAQAAAPILARAQRGGNQAIDLGGPTPTEVLR